MLKACSKGLQMRKTVLTSAFLLATWNGAGNHLTTQPQCKHLKKQKRYEKATFDPILSWNKHLILNVIWNFYVYLCLLFPSLHVRIRDLNWSLRHQGASQMFSLCQLDHTVLSVVMLISHRRQNELSRSSSYILEIYNAQKVFESWSTHNLYFFDKKTLISYIWNLTASSNLPTCNPHLHLLLTKDMKALGSHTS